MINDNSIDKVKCIQMALVHDIAEAITGDITPSDNISKEEKEKMEIEAFDKILNEIPTEYVDSRENLKMLWYEYEERQSPEAILVKDLDLFDMIYQAHEYEKANDVVLTEFLEYGDKLRTNLVKKWWEELKEARLAIQQ